MTPEQKHELIERNLTNHPPTSQGVINEMVELRALAKNLAHAVEDVVPEGREKSLAQTNIEQAVMWAMAGLARNQEL